MPTQLTWENAEDIGILLSEKHPDVDPLSVRFTDLHRYVTELPDFKGDPTASNEGKLEALKTRFRDHTIRIFQKHGIESIGYWVPQGEKSSNTLIYIVSHPSVEACSTATRALTWGGNALSRYSGVWCPKMGVDRQLI